MKERAKKVYEQRQNDIMREIKKVPYIEAILKIFEECNKIEKNEEYLWKIRIKEGVTYAWGDWSRVVLTFGNLSKTKMKEYDINDVISKKIKTLNSSMLLKISQISEKEMEKIYLYFFKELSNEYDVKYDGTYLEIELKL